MSTYSFVWDENNAIEFAVFYHEKQGTLRYWGKDLLQEFKRYKSLQFLADQAQELKMGYEDEAEIQKINKRLDDIEKKLAFKK
jgi:hypothetical protein